MDLDGLTMREPRLGELSLPLLGRHQAANAAVALGAVAALGDAGVAHVPDDALRAGLSETRWAGRLEHLTPGDLHVLIDGAHNPDGARALAATFEELADRLPQGPATLLIGVMADKAVDEIVEALAGPRALREARVVTTRVPDSSRALPADALAAVWRAALGADGRDVEAVEDADGALDRAMDLARAAGGPLVITGSLYLVGHLRPRLVPDGDDA
jgi:dihydrofolate synthase/folylpolyglutamate synthase